MQNSKRGHLKIFFSYAENSGKTQAMLRAARELKAHGTNVLVGTIAPHTSDEITELLSGLPMLSSFDLDEALRRAPDLILMDELAFSNAENCRHRKRYQDVDELLNAGIHVYTTINVSNIESLHDTVAAITGVSTWEHIPDSVFDCADQVELIDIEPQELLERLQSSGTSITIEQLTALREIALRRCADRIKRIAEHIQEGTVFRTDEHILACLSSSPSNAKIIRTAARMARAFNSRFTALFIETPDFAAESAENKARLEEHRKLARQLGASIETVYGEDIPYQIAEFARLSGITKIVLGRSALQRSHLWGRPTLTEQLLNYVPEMDVHIIPDSNTNHKYHPRRVHHNEPREIALNIVKSAVILTGATLLSLLFYNLKFTDSNIIMVYILGVLLTSVVTSHRLYSLVSSVSSVIIFNYFFTEPRFSLSAYGTGYPVTFLVMFLTAFITGTFALRYKEQAGQSAKNAYRTKVLFDTDQLLSKAKNKDEILQTTGEQIMKLLRRNIMMFENENGVLAKPTIYSPDKENFPPLNMDVETATAQWVLNNNHAAGAQTDTMSEAQCRHLAIRANDHVYSVVGIDVRQNPLDAAENGMLLSVLGETALALENDKNAREKEAAAIMAESEQLRANLLRTISHDLRTPLTSISGNACNLLENSAYFDEETKKQIYKDIYDDSLWLINLVENLLYSTRIEEGRMTLSTAPELMTEIISEVLRHTAKGSVKHTIQTHCSDEFLLVKADGKLLVQVLVNLVDNAIKYTPPDSVISIDARREGDHAVISVADTGNGIADDEKQKIFDKFYCGHRKIADNRRSLGLGLYLCKAIVEAHNGTIEVTDNLPHGTVFRFTLPLEDISAYE